VNDYGEGARRGGLSRGEYLGDVNRAVCVLVPGHGNE